MILVILLDEQTSMTSYTQSIAEHCRDRCHNEDRGGRLFLLVITKITSYHDFSNKKMIKGIVSKLTISFGFGKMKDYN
jgi:hypothetical protein